jgi:hypothetical protein
VNLNPQSLSLSSGIIPLRYGDLQILMSDIGQKFIPLSAIMSDSKHFSLISDVPISGSVRYRWSRISDWVPTYDKKRRNVHPTKLPAKIFKFYSEVWVLLVIFAGLALLPKKAGRLYKPSSLYRLCFIILIKKIRFKNFDTINHCIVAVSHSVDHYLYFHKKYLENCNKTWVSPLQD